MRKHIVNVLKILVAVVLVWFVLSKVELQDRYATKIARGETWVQTGDFTGRILTPWKAESVQFQKEGSEQVETLVPIHDEERILEIRPGLLTVVKDLDVGIFLLGALCFLFVACFSALRWWWLLHVNDLNVSTGMAIRLTWIGIFFSNVVPGITGGDVIKAFYVARLTGHRTRSIVSVIVDRILGLIALALLAAVVVIFNFADFREIGYAIYAGLIALMLGTTCMFSRRIRSMLKLDALLEKLPLSGLLKKIDQAIYFYRGHLKGIFLWLLASSLNHLLAVLGVWLIGTSLGLKLPLVGYLVLVPVINIASAVPIAPAGWGVGEYLFQKFFTDYAIRIGSAQATIMPTLALTLSLVYRLHLMLWSLLGAVFLAFQKSRPTEAQVTALMEESDDEDDLQPEGT